MTIDPVRPKGEMEEFIVFAISCKFSSLWLVDF